MTVNADVRNVQPLRDDLYIHNKGLQQTFLGSHGQETPGEAQKLITQGKRVYNLRHDGTWHLDRNIIGEAEIVIGAAYYDPDFRVRAFKIYHGLTTLFGRIVYDCPESGHVIDDYATGVLQQIWITRLYLGDPAFGNGTPDDEFRISLIG
jgi:hypothetical protein